MRTISGIKIETDLKGNPKTATIDLKKQKQLIPILVKLGAIKDAKGEFTKDKVEFSKGCYTKEDAISESFKRIQKWGWPKDSK